MTSLLVLALVGQCRTYQGYGYNNYYQGYHYGYVAPQVVYKDAYVVNQAALDPYYASLVAARATAEKQAQAKADSAAELTSQIGGLKQELAALRQAIAQPPPPQTQPINPLPPPPQPTPQGAAPQYPPVAPPKPNPTASAYGSVAPPPAANPAYTTAAPLAPQASPEASASGTLSDPAAPGLAVLRQKCAGCHSGADAQKGFAIFGDDEKLAVRGLGWLKIDTRTYGPLPGLPQMPPKAPLSSEEYAAVRALVALHGADVAMALNAKGP